MVLHKFQVGRRSNTAGHRRRPSAKGKKHLGDSIVRERAECKSCPFPSPLQNPSSSSPDCILCISCWMSRIRALSILMAECMLTRWADTAGKEGVRAGE